MRLAAALAALLASSTALAAPAVDVYTMGEGEHLFSRFGHAAICVTDERSPRGRCYNYGTADFSTPVPLTFSFLRGEALFWVAKADLPRMLELYRREDRTVFRQRLALSDGEAEALAAALEASTAKDVRYYRYHHFHDNCTTRIRDAVDRATAGRLLDGARERSGPSFRAYAREGFAGSVLLLAATELLLGSPADEPTSRWTAMFLPSVLREELAARFEAPPEAVYERRGGPVAAGSVHGGASLLAAVGALLAALVFGTAGASRPRTHRAALVAAGLVLGLVALLVDVLALVSVMPELTRNEALLVLLPTDLALGFLPAAWRRRYLELRLGHLVSVGGAAAAGVLVQPLLPLFALCGLPLLAARLALRGAGKAKPAVV